MERLRHLWMRIVPIVLIGMVFGALAPQGFMPRYGESGLSIILCSGSGATAASIDQTDPLYTKLARIKAAMSGRDGAPHSGDDRAQPSMPHCAFAGGTMAAILSSPTMIDPPSGFAPLAPDSIAAIALSRHHAARPPATGPPFLA
jgi:hypothetical protein